MPRITLNLDYTIFQVLKLKFSETKQSMSELANDDLKASLHEVLKDLKSWKERKREVTMVLKKIVELLKIWNLKNRLN